MLIAIYTSSHYQNTWRFACGYYMNWIHSPEIQDHTICQNQLFIPQETNEILPDSRESASILSEIDHMLNQEYEISVSLSELDMMLRQLESEDAPLPSTEEETNAWTVIA